jgi:hypothetical protein
MYSDNSDFSNDEEDDSQLRHLSETSEDGNSDYSSEYSEDDSDDISQDLSYFPRKRRRSLTPPRKRRIRKQENAGCGNVSSVIIYGLIGYFFAKSFLS